MRTALFGIYFIFGSLQQAGEREKKRMKTQEDVVMPLKEYYNNNNNKLRWRRKGLCLCLCTLHPCSCKLKRATKWKWSRRWKKAWQPSPSSYDKMYLLLFACHFSIIMKSCRHCRVPDAYVYITKTQLQ